MRAIANKKQREPRDVRKERFEKGQNLSQRQLYVRRLFHRFQARVETLPTFAATLAGFGIVGAFVVYGAIAGGHATAMASTATSSLGFDVHSVSITGHRYMEERDILDILGLSPGVSLVTFDVSSAHQTLLREPWIKSASVRKIYPGKLKIQLNERDPFAVWQHGQAVSIVDKGGRVLDDFNKELHGSLPIVVGHGAQRKGPEFIALMEEFPALNSRIRAAMLHSQRRWDILLDNEITVKLPEEGVREALEELLALDEEKSILSKDLVSVDMRLSDRLVMRLSDEALANRETTLKRRKEDRSEEKKI